MNILTRRSFIGSATAFGASALGPVALPAAPRGARPKPNLRLGVISDIHLSRVAQPGEDPALRGTETVFRRALEWFRDQHVEAVVLAGDMADWGYGEELLIAADVWNSVFPDDRLPDGAKVEKVFIYGNHECYSSTVPYSRKRYPDEKEWLKHSIKADMAGWWEKAFHEDYQRLYRKEIKGYTFFGCHYDVWSEKGDPHSLIAEYLAQQGSTIDPKKPFFYIQHRALKDTCNGPWAWNHDYGVATKALSAFPNAVAISGDTHYSLTDERSFWQGAFTAVNAGSMSYTGLAHDSCPPAGYENGGLPEGGDTRLAQQKMMIDMRTEDCRQGMLWDVYDQGLVIKRREFLSGESLGSDIVMPIANVAKRPFAFAVRAKKFAPPRFPAGAKVKVARVKAQNRAKEELEAISLTVPATVADAKARAFEIEFAAVGTNGEKIVKVVVPEGFNQPLGHANVKRSNACVFALRELPKAPVRFEVTPRNCYGARGKTLVVTVDDLASREG